MRTVIRRERCYTAMVRILSRNVGEVLYQSGRATGIESLEFEVRKLRKTFFEEQKSHASALDKKWWTVGTALLRFVCMGACHTGGCQITFRCLVVDIQIYVCCARKTCHGWLQVDSRSRFQELCRNACRDT